MIHRRGHYRLATLTATAAATLTIGPAAAGNTSANAVHNAGITCGNYVWGAQTRFRLQITKLSNRDCVCVPHTLT